MRRRQQAPRGCQDRLLAGSLQGPYGPIHGRRRVGISQTYVLPRHRRRGIDRQHNRLYLAQVLLLAWLYGLRAITLAGSRVTPTRRLRRFPASRRDLPETGLRVPADCPATAADNRPNSNSSSISRLQKCWSARPESNVLLADKV